MWKNQPRIYQRGDAKQKAHDSDYLGQGSGTHRNEIVQQRGYRRFLNDYGRTQALATILIQEGQKLDDQLDEISFELLETDPWFSRSKLSTLMGTLLTRRKDLRDFERDVEEFLELVSLTDRSRPVTRYALPVSQVLSQVSATHQRAYDLCLLKLHKVQANWIAAASLFFSLAAIAVAFIN